MNFWKFFKHETTEELVTRTSTEVKERIEHGMRRGIPFMDIYNAEMRNLESIEDDIVAPPWYKKKEKYRDERIQVLAGVITECKKYFSEDIDNRLKKASAFQNGTELERDAFLNDISRLGKDTVLVTNNREMVGSPENPGAFCLSRNVELKLQVQRGNGRVSLEYIENDIQKDVTNSLRAFAPQAIWKQREEQEPRQNYNKLEQHYNTLKEIMNNDYKDHNRYELKSLAFELGLTEKGSNSISGILCKNDNDRTGTSGLDFMAERHPDILADVISHKLVTKMKDESSTIIGNSHEDILSFLNPKGYIALLAQEQALSRIMGELPSLEQSMLQEFEQFRNEKIKEIINAHVSAIEPRITDGLQENKEIDQIYEEEMRVLTGIRNSILEPDKTIQDKDGFRKVQTKILEGMIKEYKRRFGAKIDERIYNAELFLNEIKNPEFLENVQRSGLGIEGYLNGLHSEKWSKADAFRFYHIIDKKIKTLDDNYQQPTVNLVESDFNDNFMSSVIRKFYPSYVLSNKVDANSKYVYNRYFLSWRSIEDIIWSKNFGKNNFNEKNKNEIRDAVETLKLDKDLIGKLPGIFEQKCKIPGATGLDFLIECHPKLLVDMLLYKMLNYYDESALKMAKNDITLLNLPKYMELHATKKTFSLIVDQFQYLDPDLKIEYEKFRDNILVQKAVKKSAENMKSRISKAVDEGTDIKKIYDEKMNRIANYQKMIVKSAMEHKNLDGKVQILKSEIAECRKYFADNMDDRLHEAEIFVENVTVENEAARNQFLKQADEQGVEKLLHEKNEKRVGDKENPGILQVQNIIDGRFKGENYKEKISLGLMESVVHEDIKGAIGKFDPENIEGEKNYNKLISIYHLIRVPIINNNYGSRTKKVLWTMANRFWPGEFDGKLDKEKVDPLSAILQKKGAEGYSGLDFMVECHPQILADIMLHKVLRDMDKAYLEIIKRKDDLTLLKSNEYLSIYAHHKELSSFTDRLMQLTDELKSGYEKFKSSKEEQVKESVKHAVGLVENRIMGGLKNVKTIEQVYNAAMLMLDKKQEEVVTLDSGIGMADARTIEEERNKKIQILKGMVKVCKNCFPENIDDRLHEAEILLNNIEYSVERSEFLRQVDDRKIKSLKDLKALLHEKNEKRVGSADNSGVSYWRDIIDQKFKKEKKERKISPEFMEKDLHQEVMKMMKSFYPTWNLAGQINEKMLNLCGSLQYKIDEDYYDSDIKEHLKCQAEGLGLGKDENSPLDDILHDNSVEGASGLDFMAECHPRMLADIALCKTLVDMDKEYLKNVYEKKDLSLLKSSDYAELFTRRMALSRIAEEFPELLETMKQEFEAFKEKKQRIHKEKEEPAVRAAEVKERHSKLFSDPNFQENTKDQKGLKEINTLLEAYTKLSSITDTDKRLSQIYYILKPKDYRVNLNDLGDFTYLLYSDAGGILASNLYKEKAKKIHGIDFMMQNYPELLDRFVAYALLRQLEKEVMKRGEEDNPLLNNENYQALMKLKESIHIEECKKSVSQVKDEYDKKLLETARLTPEFFIHCKQWYDLVNAGKSRIKTNITKEDLRVLNTNDIDKLKGLTEKYKDDVLLKEHVEYRISQIKRIEEIAKERPKSKKQMSVMVKDKDHFTLEEIPHKMQSTSQGCWSVVLSEMLFCKGSDQLDQHAIRSYRAIPTEYGESQGEGFIQNMGNGSNIGDHMNLISKILPNTALHKVCIMTSEYKNKKERLVNILKQNIKKAVKEQRAPLGIRYDGHYRLITGLNGNMAKIYDPQRKDCYEVDLSNLPNENWFENDKCRVDCFWFTDIEFKDGSANLKIDRKNKVGYRDVIEYDQQGKLHDWKYDEYGDRQERRDVEDDFDFVHENYEIFQTALDGIGTFETIYLPRTLVA